MKVFLIALFGILTACGQQEMSDINILHGHEATSDDVVTNHVVALTNRSLAARNKSYCSGTLIQDRLLITAAHCVANEQGTDFMMETSSVKISFGTKVSQTNDISIQGFHAQYDARATTRPEMNFPPNDLALILTKEPLEGVIPAPIYSSQVRRGDTIRLSGYGVTVGPYAGNDTGILRWVDVPVLKLDGNKYRIDAGKRAADWNNAQGACSGDSGGPSFLIRKGTPYLTGVLSIGQMNRRYQCNGWNSYTDLSHYGEWLENAIEKIFKAEAEGQETVRL